MYAPTKWTGVWVQRGAWFATWLLGPRALPARSVKVTSPLGEGAPWEALLDDWRDQLGPFDGVAMYRPPDAGRVGLAVLLLSDDRPVAFVKVRRGSEAAKLENETQALGLMNTFTPKTFGIAAALVSGHRGGWDYLAIAPMAGRLHRVPRRPPLPKIVDEIQGGLSGLPKPDGTPDHWLPMHGDLTPWNLRQVAGQGLVLFDWEAAGWGPPGSDLVMYLSSAGALGKSSTALAQIGGDDLEEARAFWRDYWDERIRLLDAAPNPNALAPKVRRVLDDAEAMATSG